MNRLFFRIFLWFWIGTFLVWTFAFVLPTQRSQDTEMRDRIRALTAQRLVLSGWTAMAAQRRGGDEGLAQFIGDVEERTGTPFPFVLDEEMHDIARRPPPEGAVQAAHRALEDGDVRGDFGELGYWSGTRLQDRSGNNFAVVQRLPSSADFPPNLWASYGRWAVVLFISGMVCYALARYLLAPVGTLSMVTRRLADGDLEARVGSRLQGRGVELAALGHDFDAMAERIGGLLRAQRQLLSDISHELRSPLARLYVALGLARRTVPEGEQGALDRIERETERLNNLIGELLALTRLEGGDLARERKPLDLDRLVQAVAADADFEARARGRAVRVVGAEPCRLSGYEELLHRALDNVLRNAVRHTADGTEVEVQLARVDGNGSPAAVVQVRDHGSGVAPEALPELFRPFYRTDEARERGTGGTGLGLAISERAVRLHGGEIRALNAPEGGLVVEIRLPVEAAPSQA